MPPCPPAFGYAVRPDQDAGKTLEKNARQGGGEGKREDGEEREGGGIVGYGYGKWRCWGKACPEYRLWISQKTSFFHKRRDFSTRLLTESHIEWLRYVSSDSEKLGRSYLVETIRGFTYIHIMTFSEIAHFEPEKVILYKEAVIPTDPRESDEQLEGLMRKRCI